MEQIILKWYEILGVPLKWDEEIRSGAREFEFAVKKLFGSIPACTAENKEAVLATLEASGDPLLNLLFSLYSCEALEEKYRERGVPRDILMDTLQDLPLWAGTHYEVAGQVGLGEIKWLIHHLTFELFQLGRLQFQITGAEEGCPIHGLSKGDPTLAVHIPRRGPIPPATCRESYLKALTFFPEYFPEFGYRCFTCETWLLDDVIMGFLTEGSNIRKFREEYDVIRRKESDFALDYIFGFGPKGKIKKDPSMSDLQKKVCDHLERSGKLYLCYGIRPLIVPYGYIKRND